MALYSILIIFVLFFLVKLVLISEEEEAQPKENPLKIHANRHGHRCYTEGLSYSEYNIVQLLAKNLSHNEYFIFNNIILPGKFAETTQIDHIIVSKYGIFVIESKEYSGWIFANANKSEWTQTFPNGSKFPIKNPIWQNSGHVMAVKNQLPFLGNRFFNVVVFSGDCKFKKDKPQNVLYEDELISFIKSKHEVRLKEVELLVAIGKLSMLCQVTNISNEEHVQNIKTAFSKLSQPSKS